MTQEILTAICIALPIAAVIPVITMLVLHFLINYVTKNSQALVKLKKLNAEYFLKFNMHIRQDYNKVVFFKSKRSLERADLNKLLLEHIADQEVYYSHIINEISKNVKLYKQYNEDCDKIYVCNASDWRNKKVYIKIERSLFEKNKLNPIINFNLNFIATYTSPKANNHYERKIAVDTALIEETLEIVQEMKKRKASKEYQRALMTPSMRYDIMKRDGFKCVLCGANQSDGVKLHVDHIKPVSKGGKTIPSNLRTLCDACNLGKRDKYDENGIN